MAYPYTGKKIQQPIENVSKEVLTLDLSEKKVI